MVNTVIKQLSYSNIVKDLRVKELAGIVKK
jgi:hypothetical protein